MFTGDNDAAPAQRQLVRALPLRNNSRATILIWAVLTAQLADVEGMSATFLIDVKRSL